MTSANDLEIQQLLVQSGSSMFTDNVSWTYQQLPKRVMGGTDRGSDQEAVTGKSTMRQHQSTPTDLLLLALTWTAN
jgi:hypothetical protein